MSKSIQAVALILVGLLLAQTLNCTVIGYQIGSSIDNKKPDQLNIPPWEVATIKAGTEISIYMQDNFLNIGEFIGIERLPGDDYAKRYAEFWENLILDFNMLRLDGSIAITLVSGDIIEGIFEGFDYRYVAKRDKLASTNQVDYYTMLINRGAATTKVNFNKVEKVEDQNGYNFKGTALINFASENNLPIISALAYKEDLKKELVALDDIKRIKIPNKKNARAYWTGFGALIDATVILVVAIIARNIDVGDGSMGP